MGSADVDFDDVATVMHTSHEDMMATRRDENDEDKNDGKDKMATVLMMIMIIEMIGMMTMAIHTC